MPEILEARIAPAVLAGIFQFANSADAADLVATDSGGNIYIAGIFFGLFELVPGGDGLSLNTTDPAGDVYFVKFSPDGKEIWLQSWGGFGPETLGALAVDANNDLFVTGSFDSAGAGFDGSGAAVTTPGQPELFVFKAGQSSGSAVAAFGGDGIIQFGSRSGSAEGVSLAFDESGFLLVGGSFNGTGASVNHAANPTVTSDGRDGVVVQLDPTTGAANPSFGSGGMLVVSLSPAADDVIFRLRADSSGNFFAGIRSRFSSPGVPESLALVKFLGGGGLPDVSFNSGNPLGISVNAIAADFGIDLNGNIIAAASNTTAIVLSRFDATGSLDNSFGTAGFGIANVATKSLTLLLDGDDRIYVGGATAAGDYLGRFTAAGIADNTFVPGGVATFGKHATEAKPSAQLALGPDGFLIFRDSYKGTPDLDPTAGVKTIAPRPFLAGTGMAEGFVARIDVDAVAAGQSVKLLTPGQNGDPDREIIVKLSGPGRMRVTPRALIDATGTEIDTIELFATTLASKLTVSGNNLFSNQNIRGIFTRDPAQNIGAIVLDPRFSLGDSNDDATPDLLVTGRTNQLVLGDLERYAFIKLGTDLPYNLPGTIRPDTYNNRPALTVRDVLSDGVVIENIGDGNPQGVGGGGFGKIVFHSWQFDGVLRTTQSIGTFTIQTGDFFGRLEIDKFHVGEGTTANTGMMNVQQGAWGSSGTEVEGTVGGFNAAAFLTGASITAGGIGPVMTGTGEFAGTLTLTDAAAGKLPTFTVTTDFTGIVISAAPLKKVKVKGDFKGSLTAPSIGAITAFSFIGDTAGDLVGEADKLNITATLGLLGKIKAKSGTIRNFEFDAPNALFSGIKVDLKNLQTGITGIEGIIVHAASIGPITVNLAAAMPAPAIGLTGIKDSTFTATSPTAANIAVLSVSIAGGGAAALGLDNVHFDARTIGNVTITTNAGSGAGASATAVNGAEFLASRSLGNVKISGAATTTLVTGLVLQSGGVIKSVNVSAAQREFGTIENSTILAGQSPDFTGAVTPADFLGRLAAASLGPVTLSGSLRSTLVAAGADIAGVTIGGELSASQVLAGTALGTDRAVGGGDDTFTRAAHIASVKVNGALVKSVIAAGINPGNTVFGDNDDTLGVTAGPLTDTGGIGMVTLPGGVFVATFPAVNYESAILASQIAKIIVAGQPPATDFSAPLVLDIENNDPEASDILVKVIAP